MKANYTICICFLLVFSRLHAQSEQEYVLRYDLDSVEWAKADKVWKKESLIVELMTADSVVHHGQIICVADTSLLFYEDSGMLDPQKFPDKLRHFNISDISCIYTHQRRHKVNGTVKGGIIGGLSGTAVGAAFNLFSPRGTFAPIFIVPAGLTGLLAGLSLGKETKTSYEDTAWVCTHEDLRDTDTLQGESEFVWATYRYALWQYDLPDSVKWENEHLFIESSLMFDEVAKGSSRMNTVFPKGCVYVGFSYKHTFSHYASTQYADNLWQANIGFRLGYNWLVDGYLSQYRNEIQLNPWLGEYAPMIGYNMSVALSYVLVQHDRFNARKFQLSAGCGPAMFSVFFDGRVAGHQVMDRNIFGFLCKADASVFLTRRMSMVLDVQQYFMSSMVLPPTNYYRFTETIPIAEHRLDPTCFQVALGLRVHF
jgi:hypothetical protein